MNTIKHDPIPLSNRTLMIIGLMGLSSAAAVFYAGLSAGEGGARVNWHLGLMFYTLVILSFGAIFLKVRRDSFDRFVKESRLEVQSEADIQRIIEISDSLKAKVLECRRVEARILLSGEQGCVDELMKAQDELAAARRVEGRFIEAALDMAPEEALKYAYN